MWSVNRIFYSSLIFTRLFNFGDSFASWMTTDFCDRPIRVEEVIMNNPVVASSERVIQVFRGETELFSNKDTYTPGEELTITITEKKRSQFVFETSPNAYFVKGGCEGRRIAKSPAKLIMPADDAATEKVKIWAGILAGL